MGCESNGKQSSVPPGERLNVFALVIYIPNPLGKFLDDLRRELVPHYNPHAHVSVLPPRPLAVDWTVAAEQVRARTEGWPSFEIELAQIEIFPVTNVIYIGVERGGKELRRLHEVISTDALQFD